MMVLRMPRMLIFSFPKYSSAGATLHFGAACATVFGFVFVAAAAGLRAATAAVLDGVVAIAAVVAAATSEAHAINRFTRASSRWWVPDMRMLRAASRPCTPSCLETVIR